MKINFKLSMWKIVMSFVLLLCSSTIIQAQELVKGVVHSPEGDPLIGALIQVEQDASFQGTITDQKGEFQLTVSNLDVKLVSSYLGYLPKTTALNGRSIVTIIMEEDTKELDEVIVVGYGVQKKHSVTGSIAQIDSEEILKSPIGNITASLAGKLPGLVATQKSGQPGSDGAGLKVRGISTLGNSAPIIIVDDVQRSFTNIDPNEIESISILKDATATAVYGMQAAAGVILVKTKRGKATKPTISYTGKVAYNQNTNYPKFLNGPDFITWYNKALEMDGEPAMFSDEIYDKVVNGDPDGKYANTNWFNKIMDSGAFSTHHNVNVNGGTKNVRYFVSLGYFNQDGIIDKVGFDRFNVRSNLDINLNHGFKLGVDLAGQRNQHKAGYWSLGNQSWNNPIGLTQRMIPILPTSYGGLPTAGNIEANKFNPMAFNEKTGYSKSLTNRIQSSLTLSWDLPWVQGLNFRVKGSYDKDYTSSKSWREHFLMNSYNFTTHEYEVVETNYGEPKETVIRNAVNQTERATLQPAVSYDRIFNGVHDVSALLLYEQSSYKSENLGVNAQGFQLSSLHEIDRADDILNGKKSGAVNGMSYKANSAGFVGRVNYAYDNRYIVELVARYDGSMRLPKNKRWGFFPAASVGWRISEEAFFSNLKNNFKVDDLKIRASAGLLGNDRIGDFKYRNVIKPNPPTVYIGDKEYISVFNAGDANLDLTWEKTATYNIGFDLIINRGIFGMEFDYFYKITKDILIGGGGIYPPSLGGRHPSTINGGKVRNLGLEFTLSHRHKIGQVDYYVSTNLGWSRNKILRMNESFNVPEYQKRTGGRLGQKLGFKTDGLYQSIEDIENSPTLSHLNKNQIRPGDIVYRDLNGDGQINKDQDYTVIGNSNTPELMYGINLGASWKNLDVSVFFQGAAICDVFLSGVYGNGHVDQTQFTRPFFGHGNSPYFLINNSWTPENPNAEFARLTTMAAEMGNANGWASDFWLRNGNYLRLKNVQIGYTLKNSFIKNAGLDQIKFTLTGGNLFTWSKLTKYNIDPEMPEITNGYYPQQRTFEFGVNLTF